MAIATVQNGYARAEHHPIMPGISPHKRWCYARFRRVGRSTIPAGPCTAPSPMLRPRGFGRTYIIYYFAPAVIVIRFKVLNNNKYQLLTRNFSTTFFTEEFRNAGPCRRYSAGSFYSLEGG